jgi:hypothetical protein
VKRAGSTAPHNFFPSRLSAYLREHPRQYECSDDNGNCRPISHFETRTLKRPFKRAKGHKWKVISLLFLALFFFRRFHRPLRYIDQHSYIIFAGSTVKYRHCKSIRTSCRRGLCTTDNNVCKAANKCFVRRIRTEVKQLTTFNLVLPLHFRRSSLNS